DASGAFTLTGLLPGKHNLSRRVDGRWRGIRSIEVTPGGTLRLDLMVERTWDLRVRLLDAEGKPLQGWGLSPGRSFNRTDLRRTDAGGRAALCITRGEELNFSLHAPAADAPSGIEGVPRFLGTGKRGDGEQVIRLAGALAKTATVSGRFAK